MTILMETPYIRHISVGGLTYAYDWLVDTADELEVYVDDDLVTGYAVTGLGNEAGGTIVLNTAPVAGLGVTIRRVTDTVQGTDFLTGGILAAESLEDSLDSIVKLVQNIHEILSRIPTLAPYIGTVLRNLTFPAPVPLGLIGWNALGAALSTHPSTIQQVTPSATSRLSFVQNTVEVAASTGAGTARLTASAFLPAGVIILGVVGYVRVTCGNSQGLTTWSLGDADIAERFGSGIARTAASQSNVGQHVAYAPIPIATARDVHMTTDSGLWDASGAIVLTYSGFSISPAQSA